MSLLQLFSLILLVVAFAVATLRGVNLGFTIIPAGLVLLLVAHVSTDDYFATFPASLVLQVVGVTYLFQIVQRSGAIDRAIGAAERATGRRDWLLPWVMFVLAGALSALGALPAAALAIVTPVAMRAAQLRRIDPMLMGVVTISGALAGGFSPISVWGKLIDDLTQQAHRPISIPALFALEFGLNLAVGIVAFFVYGGAGLVRAHRGGPEVAESSPDVPGTSRTTLFELLSALAVVAFVVLVTVPDWDVGLTAISLGVVLQLIFRPSDAELVRALPWSVVLVISGVLLYVGLLQKVGTFDAIAHHIGNIGSLAVGILAVAYLGALFASFESSSVAVLGIVIPVALTVTHSLEGTSLMLALALVSWAVVVVSSNPYHLSGGLVIASSPESTRPLMFRKLLTWSFGVAAVVPLIGWAIPAVGLG